MGNIANDIGTAIGNIFQPLWDFITTILDILNPYSDNFIFKKLIELLGDLLKWLFVPDENFFNNNIEEIKTNLSTKIPYQDYINMFQTIEQIDTDGNLSVGIEDYNFGNGLTYSNKKFIDFGWITKYKDTWFGWVRGFTFIFLIIYNLNQITKFLRGINVADGATVVGIEKPNPWAIEGQTSLFNKGGKK